MQKGYVYKYYAYINVTGDIIYVLVILRLLLFCLLLIYI